MFCRDIGSGPPLVFLHGWSCHGGFFGPQQTALADRFRLLLPDLPGHGATAAGANPGIPALADALHELLHGLRLHRPVLIGWSMGAMVAFDYLQRYGQQDVAGLVIEDMTARLQTGPDWHLGLGGNFDAAQNTAVLAAMRADWASHSAAFLPHLFARNRQPDAALLRWISGEIARNDIQAMAALWASMAEQDFRSLLPQLNLPCLIIHGGESQLYAPDVSIWMEQTLPQAKRLCLAQSGHMPHLEQPDAFNTALAQFASRVMPQPANA